MKDLAFLMKDQFKGNPLLLQKTCLYFVGDINADKLAIQSVRHVKMRVIQEMGCGSIF